MMDKIGSPVIPPCSDEGARKSGERPSALETIKRALHMGISTHGEQCLSGETCQAITDFREALAAVELLKAERQSDTARLDWLEKIGFSTRDVGRGDKPSGGVHCWSDQPGIPKWNWTARCISSEFKSARDAIDAAIRASELSTPDTREPAQSEEGIEGLPSCKS